MKRLIKICAIAGLVLILSGLGISSLAAVAGATVGDMENSIFSRLRYTADRHVNGRISRWTDKWEDKWEDKWDQKWDDLWDSGYWGSDSLDQDISRQTEQADALNGSGAEGQDAAARDNGYQVFSDIRSLDVEMDRGSVRLIRGKQTDNIYVKIEDHTGLTQCYPDEGKLKIKWESKRKFKDDIKVQIVVPQNYVFEKIDLNMGAAYCVAEDITTGKLEIEAGVGSIQYTGQVNGDMEVEAGVGDVRVTLLGKEQDFNYKIKCGVGSIQVGNSSYSSLGMERSVDNQARRSMDLECGIGSIEVNFKQAL